MKKLFAYSFESDRSLADIFVILNRGPWTWVMRDSEHWGDYISTRALGDPDYAMVKLFVEPSNFGINAKFESVDADAQTRYETFLRVLLDEVLPAIDARNVQPTDTYD